MTSRRPLTIEPLTITEADANRRLWAGLFSACIVYVLLAAGIVAGAWVWSTVGGW